MVDTYIERAPITEEAKERCRTDYFRHALFTPEAFIIPNGYRNVSRYGGYKEEDELVVYSSLRDQARRITESIINAERRTRSFDGQEPGENWAMDIPVHYPRLFSRGPDRP